MFVDDLDQNIALIHLKEHKSIKILNYKKILKYEPIEIIVLLPKQKLYIYGKHLNIEYFNEDELFIQGIIHSILFKV